MSAATIFTPELSASTTVRQFRLAVALALSAVAFAAIIYLVEKFVFDLPKRFVESPADVMVRAFGTAHFIVGWIFLFSSPRTYRLDALCRLGFCTLLGAAACFAFAQVGGLHNPVLLVGFYSLFLVHEVRDQADIFLAYGDGRHSDRRVLNWLSASACLLLVTVLGGAFLVNGLLFDRHHLFSEFVPQALVVALMLPALATVLCAGKLRQESLRAHGGLAAFAEIYRPLLNVYAGILIILLLGSLLGSVGFNLIILVHVTSWLVFVSHRLSRRHPSPLPLSPEGRGVGVRGAWTWLRCTPVGFITLHMSVLLIVLVLMALRVYIWQRGGAISVALATSSFPYWSLMHIAMSFARAR